MASIHSFEVDCSIFVADNRHWIAVDGENKIHQQSSSSSISINKRVNSDELKVSICRNSYRMYSLITF